MEYLSLRETKVPALGLGTWQLEGEDCRSAVPLALDLGYRHIDTAQLYGNEAEIGEAIAAASVDPDELFVTTKVWNDHRASDEVVQFRTAAELAPIACNQVEHHPFLDQSKVRQAAADAGAVLTAYSPLARGGVFDDETLRSIGEAHGKSAAQVALRWLLDQQVLVVPKATSRQHLAANLDVFDFELTPADRTLIDGLARGERLIKPAFAPNWED